MRNALALTGLLLLVSAGAHAAASAATDAPVRPLAQQLGLATPASQIGSPLPVFLSGCDEYIYCVCASGGERTIECSGTTCSHTINSVTCDGVTTFCPPKSSC